MVALTTAQEAASAAPVAARSASAAEPCAFEGGEDGEAVADEEASVPSSIPRSDAPPTRRLHSPLVESVEGWDVAVRWRLLPPTCPRFSGWLGSGLTLAFGSRALRM